jgi:predicted AlkP superfamily pyrophosphatase or phosphodiesterase
MSMGSATKTLSFSIGLLLIVTGSPGCAGNVATPARQAKAVFVIVDGIPADVVERVATPNLDAISKVGGYARAYVGGTVGGASESPTISAVSYNSLLTGTWANKHNVWDNDVADPNYTYWDIFRIAKWSNAALKTAIFSTWVENRRKLLGDGLAAAGGNKLDYHFDGLELDKERFPPDKEGNADLEIDRLVAADAARYIRANGPDLSWVYLEHTDTVAHIHGDGPEFDTAVRQMDGQVGDIWSAVTDRENQHHEDWLVLVTTDHGRDAETGKKHGRQSARERTTWIVTNNRRLNSRFRETPAIVDILPSIATHLELKMPDAVRAQLDGKSFID